MEKKRAILQMEKGGKGGVDGGKNLFVMHKWAPQLKKSYQDEWGTSWGSRGEKASGGGHWLRQTKKKTDVAKGGKMAGRTVGGEKSDTIWRKRQRRPNKKRLDAFVPLEKNG